MCTEIVQEMTNVLVRVLSEGNGHPLEQTESRLSFGEILKDIKQGYRGHRSVMNRLGLRPFKHDERVVDKFMERLHEADSTPVPSTTTRRCLDSFPATSPETGPPEWPNIVRILACGVGAVIDGFPPVSPLSVIPKAVAAAMTAFEKYHQNNEARKDLRQWIKDIEAAGDFTHLQRPMDLFQQTANTMESRPHFKRLLHRMSNY
ncbi:hypothetical protein BDZ89DRAFT_281484 [Hymenopellis radicata]|nr:hypothetical protein BDZ89DRAFT_281484 [Hymenopellis radicata]